MAITIPVSRSVLPEQNASPSMDPSRQFGNQVATPINLPDVPQGMGGISYDTSAEQNAYANFGQKISGAITSIIDDKQKKEDALRKANETVEFEKAKIDFHNEASEAMQSAKMLRQSGDLVDDDDSKGYYQSKLDILRDKYFPEGKYKNIDIDTHAKVFSLDAGEKYKDAFRDNVIIPEQTAKFVKTVNETDSARSVQALNDGRISPVEQIVPSLKSGLQAIEDQYNSAAMSVLLKPDEIEKRRSQAKLQFVQSFMVGMSERDINFADTKQDKLTLWQKQISNQQNIKSLIFGDSQIAASFGSHVDEATKAIDNAIMQKQGLIEAEQSRRQTAAIAAAERAERNAIATVKADVALYGADSKYLMKLDSLPATQKAAAMDGYETFSRRQSTTIGQAQSYEKKFAGRPNSLVNPTKNDIEMVDNHYEISKKQIATLSPQEQMKYVAENYLKAGVVPTEMRDNVRRGLNSNDPAVVSTALETMKFIEKTNPKAAASAFSSTEKSMMISSKSGMEPASIIDFRNKSAAASEGQKESEYNKRAYKSAGLNNRDNNEVGFKNKVDKEIASNNNPWYHFGTNKPEVSPLLRDEVSNRTKVYVNNGMEFKDAVSQATKDVSLTAGATSFNGKKDGVVLYSPEVMTGRTDTQIRKTFDPIIEHIKTTIPAFNGASNEQFVLLPHEGTSRQNPSFEIWVKDKHGFPVKVMDENYKPLRFNAGRTE